jgi:hypothetical protein
VYALHQANHYSSLKTDHWDQEKTVVDLWAVNPSFPTGSVSNGTTTIFAYDFGTVSRTVQSSPYPIPCVIIDGRICVDEQIWLGTAVHGSVVPPNAINWWGTSPDQSLSFGT